VEQDVVVYRAIPGQTNDVTISSPSYGDHVVDDIVPITAGPGCAAVVGDATKVTCQLPTGNAYVNVDVGDGDDRVVMASSAHSEISGGAGDDVIIGGWAPGDDQHPGDVLRGGDDMDILNGGPGQDILDGGAGGDTLSGGSGQHDAVTYQGRTAAVRADIDGASHDDGEAGEGDTIGTGVEDLFGGDAADTLTGNAGPNTIKAAQATTPSAAARATTSWTAARVSTPWPARTGRTSSTAIPAGLQASPRHSTGARGTTRCTPGPAPTGSSEDLNPTRRTTATTTCRSLRTSTARSGTMAPPARVTPSPRTWRT